MHVPGDPLLLLVAPLLLPLPLPFALSPLDPELPVPASPPVVSV